MASFRRYRVLSRFLPVSLILVAAPALAASFDCAKATTEVESAICANETLGQLDARLSEHYTQALANLPAQQADSLRTAQRAWLKTRDACTAAPAERDACLTKRMGQRDKTLATIVTQAQAELDGIIAAIPADPAAAARKLREYRGALPSAWLAYLHRFAPSAGVTASEAQRRYQMAERSLQDDDFAQSILRDINSKNHDQGVLTLLRMVIERAGYDYPARPYAHCFLFDGRNDEVYETFGPLYGSTRDSQAPICPPQGDLFARPAWKRLNDVLRPQFDKTYAYSGTIRYAAFAAWRLEELRATAVPADFLKREPFDHRTVIQDVLEQQHWPQAQRGEVQAAADAARETTEQWLRSERQFSADQARQAADAIVHDWLTMRLEFINDNLGDDDASAQDAGK